MKKIKIVIATIFQNGGDATRAIEIAKIIRDFQPKNYQAKITFISRGSRFEKEVMDLGFTIYKAYPKLKGVNFLDDFQTKFGDLIGNKTLAKEILQGEIEAYRALEPDILLYGFWPIGSIAQKIALPHVKSIAFLPLPLNEKFIDYVNTFPDETFLARLPLSVQHTIFKLLPKTILLKIPALKHPSIQWASRALGYKGEVANIFEMLRSDKYLINDFPIFYETKAFGEKFIFTGPLYSELNSEEIINPKILAILNAKNRKVKIFCTLGSSGNRDDLLEIVKVFNTQEGLRWSGIILSPKAICPLEEAKALLQNPNVYITDKFVPAKKINEQVDMVICHGGQGTLQTAITSATPLVGIATQPEQKINLEHLEAFGMAIRIPKWKWQSSHIQKSVQKIIVDKSFKERALVLQKISEGIKTEEIIAQAFWDEVNRGEHQ